MAHDLTVKTKVRQLYIEGMALTQSASANNVSYDTARRWKTEALKQGDNWDTSRAAHSLSGQGIDELNNSLVEDIVRNILTTVREVETATNLTAPQKVSMLASLNDSYAKFSKAFSRVNPAYSALNVALDTLKMIVEHLARHDRAALVVLQQHLDAVGVLVGKRYAKK